MSQVPKTWMLRPLVQVFVAVPLGLACSCSKARVKLFGAVWCVSCKSVPQATNVSSSVPQEGPIAPQKCLCNSVLQHSLQECPTKVSCKVPSKSGYRNAPQECSATVLYKSAPHECPTTVSHEIALQECPTRAFHKSVL